MLPSVGDLPFQDMAIAFIKFRDAVDTSGFLSHQCALPEQAKDVSEVVLARKVIDILKKFLLGDAD